MQQGNEFRKMCEFLANETEFLIHKGPIHGAESFVWTMPSFDPVSLTELPKKVDVIEVIFRSECYEGEWISPNLDTRKYRWVFEETRKSKIHNV